MKNKYVKLIMLISILFGFVNNVYAEEVKTTDVPNNTYIIGTHMFTEEVVLTTRHIMLGATTIDSDNITDMIVYYKTPRGKWIDGISGETITIGTTVNIEKINDQQYIKLPTLENKYANKENGETWTAYENGQYVYNLIIGNSKEYENSQITHYDVFEKGTNNVIATGKIDEPTIIKVDAGTSKTYVAKVYYVNEKDEKVYSNNSNQILLDNETIKLPTLSISEGEGTMYNIHLTTTAEGHYAQVGTTNSISGIEIYEKNGDKYTKLDGVTEYGIFVEVNAGETKNFVARAYAVNPQGNKVYSNYSNEIIIKKDKLTKPILVNTYGEEIEDINGQYRYGLAINNSEEYENTNVTNYDVFEKNSNTVIATGKINETTVVKLYPGTSKTYVAKVYYLDKNNNKIYSDNSNEITITKEEEIQETGKERFIRYLEDIGYVETSDNVYSMYDDGYIHMVNFENETYSIGKPSGEIMSIYFYKENFMGTTTVNGSVKVTTIVGFSPALYSCKTEPSYYQSSICTSEMKETAVKIGVSIKAIFETYLDEAGVDVSDL